MKKLGGGWQYTVYDMGNGRVYKKFKSPIKRFFTIFNWKSSPFEAICEVKRMKIEVTRSFEIVKENKIPLSWLGNPELLQNFDCIQDKVRPLPQIFNLGNLEENKKIVDMLIGFIQKLLDKGFIDLGFKVSNFALDKDNNIILSDIGEIVEDQNMINEQRKERDWHSRYVEKDVRNVDLRKYYRDAMDRHFGL